MISSWFHQLRIPIPFSIPSSRSTRCVWPISAQSGRFDTSLADASRKGDLLEGRLPFQGYADEVTEVMTMSTKKRTAQNSVRIKLTTSRKYLHSIRQLARTREARMQKAHKAWWRDAKMHRSKDVPWRARCRSMVEQVYSVKKRTAQNSVRIKLTTSRTYLHSIRQLARTREARMQKAHKAWWRDAKMHRSKDVPWRVRCRSMVEQVYGVFSFECARWS